MDITTFIQDNTVLRPHQIQAKAKIFDAWAKYDSVVKEIFLCDYYLVIGSEKSFKIYPFIKKRGKATDGVGNCVFEYDENKCKVEFTDDTWYNHQGLNGNIKLQSVVAFAAMLADVSIEDVVNIRKLQELSQSEKKNMVSAFEVLEMIGAIYKKK